jgi:hypothetical protein
LFLCDKNTFLLDCFIVLLVVVNGRPACIGDNIRVPGTIWRDGGDHRPPEASFFSVPDISIRRSGDA